MRLSRLLPVLTLVLASQVGAKTIEREYDGFKLWIDCDIRGAYMYSYVMDKDYYNQERPKDFTLDPEVPTYCQQTSTKTYRVNGKSTHDRGHLVDANSQDYSETAILQSNYMTNVWPQHRDLNRGAMYQTEKIADCYRDLGPIKVMGGIVRDAQPANTDYLQSHGIKTPGYFWKVLMRDDRAIAWIFPNREGVTKQNLDKYLVSIHDLEKIVKVTFPIPEYLKETKPERSWYIPRGCNVS